jgi:FixJ family two-component response regulator
MPLMPDMRVVLHCFIAEEPRVPHSPVIAIVDDDESFRQATISFICSLGYSAAAFPSADAFLNSTAVENTDCLITDVQMPGMSGIELQSHLIAQGQRVPAIFVTAFPETEARGRALRAGAVGFLGKPFGDQSLISCLDKALATGHADNL